MVVLSKEEFHAVVDSHSCSTFVHPWSTGCLRGALDLLVVSAIGCTKFSGTLCLLQIAIKGKNITREQLFNILEHGIRLSACGISLSLIITSGICLQKNLCGLNYYSMLTIPGFLSGLSIFIVRRSKRHMFISALACSVLETCVSLTRSSKNKKTSPLKLTVIFMLTNSLFMYFLKLWKSNRAGHLMPELWFFAPSHQSKSIDKPPEENCEEKRTRPCNHIQSCIRSILKESSNYFCYGIAIEVLRILSAKMKVFARHPRKLVPFLCRMSTLRVATFAGLYVFLFKVTNCTLCRMYGNDRPLNSLIAGLISGTSVYVYPKDTLIITVFVNLIHVMWRYYGINQKYLGNFYTSELLFMLFCAFLFNVRVVIPDHCPRFFINLISFASAGRSDAMIGSFYDQVKAYRLQHI